MSAEVSLQKRLPGFRRIAGLSARELADKAGNGLTRGIIANIESGRVNRVSIDHVIAIATALDICITELVPQLIPVSPDAAKVGELQKKLDAIARIAYGALS